jgi:hypothetical protein
MNHENAFEQEPHGGPQISEIRAKVDQILDNAGKPIEPGIKETIVGLMANNIVTYQSCEGHMDRGAPYPWVWVGEEEPEGVMEGPGSLPFEQWAEANRRLASKVDVLLEGFNATRQSEIHLGTAPIWRHPVTGRPNSSGEFRIVPIPTPSEASQESLDACRREMGAFADYLIDRVNRLEA